MKIAGPELVPVLLCLFASRQGNAHFRKEELDKALKQYCKAISLFRVRCAGYYGPDRELCACFVGCFLMYVVSFRAVL